MEIDRSVDKPMKGPNNFPLNNPAPIPQMKINVHPINPSPQQVVINQTQPQILRVISLQFGTHPIAITCQFCRSPITTVVEKSFNCCSCLLCYFTSLIFWIIIQAVRGKEINCWNAVHSCPNCGQILGKYSSC